MAASDDVKAMASLTKLVRNRRNVPVFAVPQFKRLPDFWGWYKYFMDTHNQEGVSADPTHPLIIKFLLQASFGNCPIPPFIFTQSVISLLSSCFSLVH